MMYREGEGEREFTSGELSIERLNIAQRISVTKPGTEPLTSCLVHQHYYKNIYATYLTNIRGIIICYILLGMNKSAWYMYLMPQVSPIPPGMKARAFCVIRLR